MAQSVVIGLPRRARVRSDMPIAKVLYFERSIENINIYYLLYLQVVIQLNQLVQITVQWAIFQKQAFCESRVELHNIRESSHQ